MVQNYSLAGIEVICGPMFSGKTEELIRRIRLSKIAGQRVQIFTPAIDDLHHQKNITNYPDLVETTIAAEKASDILQRLYDSTRVVGIEEAHLFDDFILKVTTKLVKRGVRVICTGLDLNFNGRPFHPMAELLAIANRVEKAHAICTICGAPASKTFCLVSEPSKQIVTGNKAPSLPNNGAEMTIEDSELFAARCNLHYDAW